MDAVKAFNAELSSLYEVKPPISKAKMTNLTRGAIKAIKFYKHVVQSVEKFILKCKPEYKVPGLYVIDSIVRQSRHQFGADKDVFAPRFAKNMQQTFLNLYKCPPEDKSKIIRVLNLWQKNQVFPPEVVQPLFDLADPNNPIHKELEAAAVAAAANGLNSAVKGSPALQKTPTKQAGSVIQTGGNDVAIHGAANLNLSDPNVLAQLQHLQRLLTRSQENNAKGGEAVHFDKKLLDFDYGDDDDEVNPSPRPPANQSAADSVANLLSNPEVLRQLQTLQQSMVGGEMDMEKMRRLQEMKQQEDEFDKHLAQTVPNLPFASECEFKPSNATTSLLGGYFLSMQDLSQPPPNYKQVTSDYDIPAAVNMGNLNSNNNSNVAGNDFLDSSGGNGGGATAGGGDVEVITLDQDDSRSDSDDRYSSRRRRSHSRSRDRGRDRDRGDRRRRSKSRSRSRSRRHRSRSRDRRGKEKEREKETEKDKERKKRGLPAIKKDNLSVCSTTLWVGHLSRLVHQDDLSNTFGEFGDIVSIDLIPPRGCAFIVMHRRQDAARCLIKLKNHIIHGKAITLAWAPGKGVKGKDLKDYWEGDLGVSYIPWNKIKEDIDLEMLEDGGMIDEDTMPAWMKVKMQALNESKRSNEIAVAAAVPAFNLAVPAAPVDTSQPPPPMPGTTAGLLQPPPMLPLVSPFQFNNRLLGMNMVMGNMPAVPPNLGIPTPGNMANLGVPPPPAGGPNLMTPNSNLLGLAGSPFQLPIMNSDNKIDINPPPNFNAPSMIMDENMDIEMEDAGAGSGGGDKDKPIPLSEQLQAMQAQFNNRNRGDERRNSNGDRGDNRRNYRDERRRRSPSRERDRNRNSSRERRNEGRGNDRRDNRRERDDRRGNRWSDRYDDDRKRDRDQNRDSRSDSREKSLTDRLQEMAGMPPQFDDRNRTLDKGGPFPSGPGGEGNFFPSQQENFFDPPRGMPVFDGPPQFEGGPPSFEGGPPPFDGGPPFDGPPFDGAPPFEGGPHFDGPPFDGPPFDGPPFDGPPDRFMRGGRRNRDDDLPPRGMMRGDFPPFSPPRDDFCGLPRPLLRGGPDFGPRGMPPMMRGGPRGGFFPRGPPMRGPRPGSWKDRQNFNPRFDGPPDFFRGGPPNNGPPPLFDAPPMRGHRGQRGFDNRRGGGRHDFNPEFYEGAPLDHHGGDRDRDRDRERDRDRDRDRDNSNHRHERRSRWGGNSNSEDRDQKHSNDNEAADDNQIETNNEDNENREMESGNMTPLRDEGHSEQDENNAAMDGGGGGHEEETMEEENREERFTASEVNECEASFDVSNEQADNVQESVETEAQEEN